MTALSPFNGMNLDRLLEARARERPSHPFLIWAPFDGEAKVWTYRQFAADAARLAGGLAARGVGPGDRVLVHFENCPEALLVRFALARLGAVCVATNAMAVGPEIAHYAEASRATAAITQASFAELVSAHARNVRWVAAAERDSVDAGYGADSLSALFAEPAPAYPALHSDTAAIMFTTGTTGKPKGVVWTHSNVLWGCCYSAQVYGHRAEDVSLISLPLYHVVGLCWSFFPVLWAGGTAVLQPRFSASRFWPASIAHRATLTSHVLFTSMALQSQTVPERHFFRQWTVGRGDRQSQSFNRIPAFVPSWGMTELVAPGICGDPNFAPAEGALGRPSLAHQIRIRDLEGKPVRAGETGELTIRGIRGLSIFQDYDGDPAATAAAFDADGFFRTGDRVTLLDEGWIKFSDRASDVIKVGGEGVSPSEIEAVIRGVRGVRDVAVVGAQDEAYGQVPVAFVEAAAEPGRDLEGDILASCRVSLAKFKVPRRVVLLSELPRVGNAKIARGKLRQML
jgi:crotonobetaine/carnitine-CoA ligase